MKKTLKWTSLSILLLFLAGCVGRDVNGQPTGFIWDIFGHPMEQAIYWFANLLGNSIGSYGLGIIAVTIIVRLVLMPSTINMMKTNAIQQERMSYIKEDMAQLNQAMRQAATPEEQMRVRQEIMQLQQNAGIQMISAGGCLPMLIQFPLFSALYFAVISSEKILNDVFLGISLREPSMWLMIISSLFYLIQGLISQVGLSEEQKKLGRSMIFMSPLMNVLFASFAPAGAALYWTIGGIFSCLTSAYVTFNVRPRVKDDVAKEMQDNPIQRPKPRDITPHTSPITQKLTSSRRNEGKQKR